MQYRTQSAYLSGAICGAIWWPVGAKCGKPLNVNLDRVRHRFSDKSGLTFRDMLLHILSEEGGDFQGAEFTADTVIRVERVAMTPNGRMIHVREREISELADLSDLVDANSYVCDFMGDD